MRRRHILIAITAAALAPIAAAIAAGPPAGAKKEPRICRNAQRVVGSHIREPRICRTAEEWQRLDNAPLPVSLRVNQSQNEGGPQRAQ